MAAIARLTGASLSFKLDSQEYMAEISSWELSEEEADKDIQTFADESSAKQKLKIAFLQSLQATSLHQVLFDNPGRKNVQFKLIPSGNIELSTDNPAYQGTLNFPKLRPTVSAEAKSEGSTTEVEFDIVTFQKVTSEV
ncbi:hypothetical protein RQN30_02305 [Arcanobacterium hippocoleae]